MSGAASNTRTGGPLRANLCNAYRPAKPVPTTTASRITNGTVGGVGRPPLQLPVTGRSLSSFPGHGAPTAYTSRRALSS